MSKLYTTNTAALRAVTIDSNIINTKKLMIYPGTGERTERKDIIEIIDDNIDELKSQLNPYLNQQIHDTPVGKGVMGDASILVIPANIFNSSKLFKYVKFNTKNVNNVEHIAAYLGVILWDKNGNKTVLAVSENSEITSVSGTKLFSFSKAFSIPADTRIMFYLLKSQEDVASEYPNYQNGVPRISCFNTNESNYDPYDYWDDALTDINEGFIVREYWDRFKAYPGWPVFSIIEDVHELNGSHLTPEQLAKLDNLDLNDLLTTDDVVTKEEGNAFNERIKELEKTANSTEINSPIINAASVSAHTVEIGRESLNSSELAEIKELVLGQKQQIVSNTEGSGAIGQVVAARIANPYFPSGIISNVRIFHNVNHTNLFDNEPRYLYLNVDGTVYRSKAVVWDGPVSYTDFKFNNITIPENYTLVDVLMSKNGALENPSYSNRTGSVNFSSSITYAANTYGNSRVRIYQGGEAEIGYSAIIKVEVTVGEENTGTILNSITTITDNISALTAAAETHITAEYFDSLVYKLAENADDTADCDAIHYKANKVPHNFAIDEIGIPVTNTITTPTYLAVWTVNQSDQKTYIGLSDNAITWNSGDIATWSFRNNPISIPENHSLELFLTITEPAEGSNEATAPGYYIGTHCDYSGSGTMRWGDSWHPDRDVYTIFKQLGINDRISYLEKNGTNNEEINNINNQITTINNTITENKTTLQNEINEVKNSIEETVQSEINNSIIYKYTDCVLDSNDFGVGNNDYSHNDNAYIKYARVSKAHFIKPGCKLKLFTLPYKKNNSAADNQWLHIEYFDANGIKITQHTSELPQNIISSSENFVRVTWSFADDNYVPSNYAYIQISFSANAEDTPSTTQNYTIFRGSLVRNSNGVFDNDECHIWMDNNTDSNQLLNFKVEYEERISTLASLDSLVDSAIKDINDYSFKVKPIYNTDNTLSYFNISSGNVYLENKQIVHIPAKENLQMNSSTGNTQYVVLNVFNNPNGTVTYAYNAVNEDELIELGYSIITPTEEIINLNN